MVEVGTFHNGSTNIGLKRLESGHIIPDADFDERRADAREVARDQIEHGINAEKAGLDRVYFTEHHFQPMGLEFSTNPLMSQMQVARETDHVKLAQISNIIVWHDPVRLAEQTALLDVMSDGRVEVGIGRGYQPRENEVFGQYWGGTIQSQEQNRVSFEEKFEILKQAWTEDLFSHHGEYHQIPPAHTKWHHGQEKQYLADDVTSYDVDDMLEWIEEEDEYSSGGQSVTGGRSRLKTLNVLPKPVQEPFPQLWQPINSSRSVKWAARNGVNPIITLGPAKRISPIVETYYEAAEEAGWPDVRPEYDGEPFAYGWDEERHRGVAIYRPVFNTEHGTDEQYERFKMGQEFLWQWFDAFFGLERMLSMDDDEVDALRDRRDLAEDDYLTPDMQLLKEKQVAIVGDSEEIADQLVGLGEDCGYEDFNVAGVFECAGLSGEEIDGQMEVFGEEVVPYLEGEYPSP
ncbi:LLM class flavin-dependent oxidoreductase [Halorarum halobium]|uniref:LLM class flavin-dependent oxidoreductase n=1 Tax=Halorarum halobium TaxID=3075121 RepID=UPI0028AE6BA7|nr:LLM class flavin-dependent oxidoreductase [Halobaculum sp. XH14]